MPGLAVSELFCMYNINSCSRQKQLRSVLLLVLPDKQGTKHRAVEKLALSGLPAPLLNGEPELRSRRSGCSTCVTVINRRHVSSSSKT